jgi:hypothetical protein
MTIKDKSPDCGTGNGGPQQEKWVIGYYHCDSDEPKSYMGSRVVPALFSQQDALEEAARLNAEHINCLQEEAFNSRNEQIWRYAAVRLDSIGGIEGTTREKWTEKLPPVIGVQEFHDLCHGIANKLTPPNGLSTHDVGQMIKTRILGQLPPDIVELGSAKWPESFFCDGTFRFPKPIPREVLLKAMVAAGLAIKATDEEAEDV